jgi:hypothetical protein
MKNIQLEIWIPGKKFSSDLSVRGVIKNIYLPEPE